MHNKDKVILDKKLPYEYNICLYALEELCDKGIIGGRRYGNVLTNIVLNNNRQLRISDS